MDQPKNDVKTAEDREREMLERVVVGASADQRETVAKSKQAMKKVNLTAEEILQYAFDECPTCQKEALAELTKTIESVRGHYLDQDDGYNSQHQLGFDLAIDAVLEALGLDKGVDD